MSIQATVSCLKNQFIAVLSDGQQVERSDLHQLANALHRAGVKANSVQYEWHSGQRMITAGQQVAICAAIRDLEQQCGPLAIAA